MLLIGTVIVAFAPLLFGKLHGRLHDHRISWISLIGSGEVLLIASALIADGVGRTAALPGKIAWRVAVLVLGIGAIVTGSYEYGSVATDRITQTDESKDIANILTRELSSGGPEINSSLATTSAPYVEAQKLANLILHGPYNEDTLAQDSGVILLISFLIQFVALMLEED